MKKLFSTVFQPMYPSPVNRNQKMCDIPAGSILVDANKEDGEWRKVEYHTNMILFTGWVRGAWVEDFDGDEGPIIKIANATKSMSDAAQYVLYNGTTQYNLCGQFCVAYCAGWLDLTIEDFLDEWKAKPVSVWKRIFRSARGSTTGIPDLIDMLSVFEGYEKIEKIQDALKDPVLGRILFTPGRLQKLTYGNRAIIGCTIESQFGRLRPSGIPHWVVVEKVIPMGRGGLVYLYNPFSNENLEIYSWEEFRDSVKTPSGILVPRS